MACNSSLTVLVLGIFALICSTLLLAENAPLRRRDVIIGHEEASHQRSFFYAGGSYIYNETANGTIVVGKQYVEKLTPACGIKQKYPMVFFHGGGDSGVQWLNKPDGGQGWASYFLNKGYEVYIIDIWSVGRSIDSTLPDYRVSATTELSERAFSAPELSKKYYQSRYHTQWPGNGTKGDIIFDTFYATLLPLNIGPRQQNISRESTCAALALIDKPSILVTHSASGSIGLLTTDLCPDRVAAHVALEADQSPFTNYDAGTTGAREGMPTRPYGIADVPIHYDPPLTSPTDLKRFVNGTLEETDGLISKYPCIQQDPAFPVRKLPNIAQAPWLFLTSQASVHSLYNQCLVFYLQQAGVTVDWVKLWEVGILGNGHFMMLEKNSGVIAEYVDGWIQKLP